MEDGEDVEKMESEGEEEKSSKKEETSGQSPEKKSEKSEREKETVKQKFMERRLPRINCEERIVMYLVRFRFFKIIYLICMIAGAEGRESLAENSGVSLWRKTEGGESLWQKTEGGL